MINWKVRLRNKMWLTSFASQTALLIQGVLAGLVGLGVISIDLAGLDSSLKIALGMVDVVLAYFSFLGIVQDPTTEGIGDSAQALEYSEPKVQDK
ncbi:MULTISPECIES: phage holin [Bacillus]|uniref:phage holin n=1 Tax=Bacillus TaxID=1386 RepID=UPI0008FB6597|nr:MULTISPECIES: phage holin [Bacillus]MEC3606320.1 phage holin [Bacillus glycinifermentans]OIS74604.1 holin [Bacillus licheniformis]OIS80629.1 holin [Bacillus licheniformis]OIS82212.1 holin [Bacillus licheniformis]OIS89995.1 holin [Bacillus licheniformis]